MSRTAIITGSANGIGKAIAETIASQNNNVIISDINVADGQKVSDSICNNGNNAYFFPADVSKINDIKRLISFTIDKFSSIDILINNAAVCLSTPIEQITVDEWDSLLNINLRSVMFCSQQAFPHLIKSSSGRIVNISSLAGKVGGIVAGAHYSASKAGVISLTKSYAQALAKYGVTVNAICPGFILTKMQEVFSDEQSRLMMDGIPLGKAGTPSDVSEVVSLLISEKAGFITGEIIDVNGGSLMD